jgi:hypothetical protein
MNTTNPTANLEGSTPQSDDPRQVGYYARSYKALLKSLRSQNQIQIFSGDSVLAEHDYTSDRKSYIFAGHLGSFWAPPFYSSHVWRGRRPTKQPDSLQTSIALYDRSTGLATFEEPSSFEDAYWYPSKLVVSRGYPENNLNINLRGVKMALPGRSYALKIELENNDQNPRDLNLLFLVSLNTLRSMDSWRPPVIGWNWHMYPTVGDLYSRYVTVKYKPEGIAVFYNQSYQAYVGVAPSSTSIPVSYELDNWTIHPSEDRDLSMAYYFYDHGGLRDVSRESPYTYGAAAGFALEIPQIQPDENFDSSLLFAVGGSESEVIDQITQLQDHQDLEFYADSQWEERLGTFVSQLPELETSNQDFKRIYYNSALTYLLNRWDTFQSLGQASFYGRSTAIFPWFTGIQSFLALADPAFWRDQLLSILRSLDFNHCRAYQPMGEDLHLCDVTYASSCPAIVQAIYEYIFFTGDDDILDEMMGSTPDATILETIRDLALYRPDGETEGLVDFGTDGNLYEFNVHCDNPDLVGKYTHIVPSTNAEYYYALKMAAELMALKGEDASTLHAMADDVGDQIVNTLWDEAGWNGTGWFNTLRPYEQPDPFPAVAVLHLMDVPNLITSEQRSALLEGLESEYLSQKNRFTSLPVSWEDSGWCSRADWHGPGLYSGEVGLMLARLFQNGSKDLAAQILWDEGGDGSLGYRFLADIPISHQAYSHKSNKFPNGMDLAYLEGVSISQAVIRGMIGVNPSDLTTNSKARFSPRLPDAVSLYPLELRHIHLQGVVVNFSATSPTDIQLKFTLPGEDETLEFHYDPDEDGHQLQLVIENVEPEKIYAIRVKDEDGNSVFYQSFSDPAGSLQFEPIPISTPSGIEFPVFMGEVGQIEDQLTHQPFTVNLSQRYENPVVFAQPLSYDGRQAALARITDIQSDSFTLYVQEAPNLDRFHTTESVSYLVLEAGYWELAEGTRLGVGVVNTGATVGSELTNQWESINFEDPFTTTPVVISQVQSKNDPHWVKTRQDEVTDTGFKVALEEEEGKPTPHDEEYIGWLAIEGGAGNWNDHKYQAANTPNAVTHNWYQITFDQLFDTPPRFLATLASYIGSNSAHLRFARNSLLVDGVKVKVEEDTVRDEEIFHIGEVAAYLVIQGDGDLSAQSTHQSEGL